MTQNFISQIDLETEIVKSVLIVKSASNLVNKFINNTKVIRDKNIEKKYWYSCFDFYNKINSLLILTTLYREKFGDKEYEKKYDKLTDELIIGKDAFNETFINYLIKKPVYLIKKKYD